MEYIPVVISTVAILVSLYLAFHKEHRDDQATESKESKELSVAFARMDVKQDSILTTVNEIRLDQKQQNQKIAEIEKKMVVIEASTKSAHRRLDEVVKRIGIKEEIREERKEN